MGVFLTCYSPSDRSPAGKRILFRLINQTIENKPFQKCGIHSSVFRPDAGM